MGFALDWIYNKIHKIVGVAILLIVVGMMFSSIYPVLNYRAEFCGPKSFAYTLKDTIEGNSIVIAMAEAPHLQYYGRSNTIKHPSNGDSARIDESISQINGYLANGTNVYVVSTAFEQDAQGNLSYYPDTKQIFSTTTTKVYDNLVYDPALKTLTDTSTGVSTGFYGIWQAELFSNFKVLPVKTVENEHWLARSVALHKFNETIFKISRMT
jgi:hypothetical protein